MCRLLSETKIAGKPASYFFDPSVEEWCADFGVVWDKNQPEQDMLEKVITAVLAKGRSENGLFALRQQAHGLKFLCDKLAIIFPHLLTDADRFAGAFGHVLYIHLSRPDKVAQAISYQKAKQTGLWHMAPDGSEIERTKVPAEPIYDRDVLKHYVDMMATFDAEWNNWFERQKISPLRISYDDLSADPNSVLAEILDKLGLDNTIAASMKPSIKKLSDEINHSWGERFKAENSGN